MVCHVTKLTFERTFHAAKGVVVSFWRSDCASIPKCEHNASCIRSSNCQGLSQNLLGLMYDQNSLSLSTLPIELVYRVLNHLRPYQILLSAYNVCMKLNSIIDTNHPYQVNLNWHVPGDRLIGILIFKLSGFYISRWIAGIGRSDSSFFSVCYLRARILFHDWVYAESYERNRDDFNYCGVGVHRHVLENTDGHELSILNLSNDPFRRIFDWSEIDRI